jgi:DNA polymerase elongation subunit (family B)
VRVADEVASKVNSAFPEFMQYSFNCINGNEKLIKAAREIVGESALFLRAKKKYTIRVVNLDGKDLRDKPKLKSMGSEIKKADTPKVIQDFLKEVMSMILGEAPYSEIEKFINIHRGVLVKNVKNPLDIASAKQVNDLDNKYAEYKRIEKTGQGKVNLPGHVRAAVNYNEMISIYDSTAKPIRSGDKIVILYLKANHYRFKTMAFPADQAHLPSWFLENFEVDLKETEIKMIDSKLDGIFEALGLDVPTHLTAHINSTFTF